MLTELRLVLPVPPSVNAWKSPARAPRNASGKMWMRKSTEFRAYSGAVQIAWQRQHPRTKPLLGPLAMTVHWYRARAAGDLDGRLKALCDALNGLAYADDAQICELHAYRYEDKRNPRCEVLLRALGPDAPRAAPDTESGPVLSMLARPATYRPR